jgi:hypothetical protein
MQVIENTLRPGLKPGLVLSVYAGVETPFFHPSDKDPSLGTRPPSGSSSSFELKFRLDDIAGDVVSLFR